MQGSATVSMAAPADKIWDLIADVRNTGRFSPEVFEAEWLGGATGPALGARFRGHVKRNEMGPVYWTTCRVTACEPGREFGFDVLVGDRAANTWHYQLAPVEGGTEVGIIVNSGGGPAGGGFIEPTNNFRKAMNFGGGVGNDHDV